MSGLQEEEGEEEEEEDDDDDDDDAWNDATDHDAFVLVRARE